MDPDHLQRPVNDYHLTNVQRWVMSVLAVFTVAHLAVGIALAAQFVQPGALGPRIGLNVIAMIFGALGLAGGFAIHGHKPFTWPWARWLPLGAIPGIVGLVLALR